MAGEDKGQDKKEKGRSEGEINRQFRVKGGAATAGELTNSTVGGKKRKKKRKNLLTK